ncbi:MAG TPA: transglutaminase family protein, partial [Verrucomicrobiae bacterium]
MKWEIIHRTRYTYATPVRDSFNDVRLQPMPIPEQTVESFLLKVIPAVRLTHSKDFYSNWIHHFDIVEPHSNLLIEANSIVITHPPAPLPDEKLCSFEQMRAAPNIERCFDYLLASRFVELSPTAWKLALDATVDIHDAWQAALALMRFVHGFLKYESASTHVHTHMSEVMRDRRGVCQDFAHLMIGLSRALKIPARYVSGYLATEAASATHAWVEVFIPGHGWRGLDPT